MWLLDSWTTPGRSCRRLSSTSHHSCEALSNVVLVGNWKPSELPHQIIEASFVAIGNVFRHKCLKRHLETEKEIEYIPERQESVTRI